MKRKLRPQAVEYAHATSVEDQSSLYFARKQRSQISRRRRLHISPVVVVSLADSHFTSLTEEVSCDSSVASVISHRHPLEEVRNDQSRRVITRSYYRKKFKNSTRVCDESVEVSDTSCVESCSGANRELNSKTAASVKELEFEGEVAKSEVSYASRFSFCESERVNEAESAIRIAPNEVEFEIPKKVGEAITNLEAEKVGNDAVSVIPREKLIKTSGNSAAASEVPKRVAVDLDLTCSELFSNGGVIVNGGEEEEEEEEYNSSSPDIYQIYSDLEFGSSEYTPSLRSYASGSEFSEKSVGGSSSPTFELFRQFKEQFCRATFGCKACDENHSSHEVIVLGLENEEDEESYRLMRKRERRQEDVHDYAEEYCITTAYGDLVIQQRLHMVHWIVEQATSKDLQKETMFLGVSLFDRFLSKGYFRDVGKLQIAGIACLTLATRIEENQPYNSVRKMTFYVGNTTYGRCEVVAMEWLVQEVLNFQCFRPTLYNFLWFYLKAAKANAIVEKTAKYLAVLTLMGHQQLCFWPSTVAAGLVILASIAANQDASCRLVTGIHARHKDDDLPECIKSLEWLVKYL